MRSGGRMDCVSKNVNGPTMLVALVYLFWLSRI